MPPRMLMLATPVALGSVVVHAGDKIFPLLGNLTMMAIGVASVGLGWLVLKRLTKTH